MSKRVLILVPSYRCEQTVLETLESIQKQGAGLAEVQKIVIADDGSRDKTAEMARAAWRVSVPLQILERRFNCGEYASVNSAVEQLAPEMDWFLIMHADNIAKPGWLEVFLDRIEKATDDIGLIGSSYDCFADNGPTRPGEDKPGIVTVRGTKESIADTLKMGCWWHISSCAIRVDTFVRVGGLPKVMQLKGDWDFMLRVLADGWTIEHIPKSLMLYRDNPAGSSSISFQRHMDMWETMAVVGRFHGALDSSGLAGIHARHIWFLIRRIVGCVVRFHGTRLLWAFPAMGCVIASYWSCCFDRKQTIEVVPRRLGNK